MRRCQKPGLLFINESVQNLGSRFWVIPVGLYLLGYTWGGGGQGCASQARNPHPPLLGQHIHKMGRHQRSRPIYTGNKHRITRRTQWSHSRACKPTNQRATASGRASAAISHTELRMHRQSEHRTIPASGCRERKWRTRKTRRAQRRLPKRRLALAGGTESGALTRPCTPSLRGWTLDREGGFHRGAATRMAVRSACGSHLKPRAPKSLHPSAPLPPRRH